MDKRVIVFLVVSLGILLAWDYLLREMGVIQVPVEEEQAQPVGDSAGLPASGARDGEPADRPGASLEAKAAGRDAGSTGAGSSVAEPSGVQRETVETDLFRAVLTNQGASILSWELKTYQTGNSDNRRPVQLVSSEGQFPRPLSLQVPADPALTERLRDGLYAVERDFTTLSSRHPTGHMTFRYRAPDSDLQIEKRLTFHYDRYLVDIEIRTQGLPSPANVRLGTNFGIVEWGEGFIGLIGPAYMVDGRLEKGTPDERQVREGNIRWVAIQDKYFMSVLIPTAGTAAVVQPEGERLVSAGARFASAEHMTFQLFAGPKEYDRLKAMQIGLEDTIDFGWFIYGSWSIVKAVAKPLFYVLRFLYDYTGNYGWSIILLTVGIKMLFVPLQYKSYKSMKDMQVIQPKVGALQQKYKDDRERLNKELIKLYRDHKVNPVGGCLPMLLQMPVFVALFNILYMNIELRQAPWILWIHDLSVQDPYYVLPVLMGVSMVVQQKIMPTTMDPTQAKIMLLLPAFLTILFLTFPAGLVLYWFTNNILTIGQQFVTDRYIFKKPTLPSVTGPEPGKVPDPAPDGGQPSAAESPAPQAHQGEAAETQPGDGRKSGKGKKKKGKGQGTVKPDEPRTEADRPVNT